MKNTVNMAECFKKKEKKAAKSSEFKGLSCAPVVLVMYFIRKNIFMVMVVRHLNRLLREAVDDSSFEGFRVRFYRVWAAWFRGRRPCLWQRDWTWRPLRSATILWFCDTAQWFPLAKVISMYPCPSAYTWYKSLMQCYLSYYVVWLF